MQKMMRAANKREFDLVLTESLDRLSRDQEDIAGFYKRMRFNGVRIVTLAEGEISELHVGLKGTMSALFLQDLAAKTHRGLRGRVEGGKSAGGRAYGYEIDHTANVRGETERGGRRINEIEAEIVRRIFREFEAGHSPRAIARQLNAADVAGPNGKPWLDTTIRGHHERQTGILRNELYVGRLIWNKLRYIKDPDSGKRISRLNPVADWITKEVPALRIVDDMLWQKVQTRLGSIRNSPGAKKIRETRFWEERRPKHVLTGLVQCGSCKHPLSTIGKGYLACSRARRYGLCDNRTSIAREKLERLILDGLRERLMAPDLVQEFITAFHAEENQSRRARELEAEQAERELAKVDRQLNALVDAITGGMKGAALQLKLDQLESCKAELERKIAEAPAPTPRLHPNLAGLYRRKVENLHDALTRPDTRTEATEILRSLIEAVVIHPAEGGAGVEIELIGEIAGMVDLAQSPGGAVNNKTPRGGGVLCVGNCGSVKLVAGTGFEPVTFRL